MKKFYTISYFSLFIFFHSELLSMWDSSKSQKKCCEMTNKIKLSKSHFLLPWPFFCHKIKRFTLFDFQIRLCCKKNTTCKGTLIGSLKIFWVNNIFKLCANGPIVESICSLRKSFQWNWRVIKDIASFIHHHVHFKISVGKLI